MAVISCVALIPARGGSERVVGKNIRPLAGVPLIARKIEQARKAGYFTRIIVSTDSKEIGDASLGVADLVVLRPAEYATSTAPDIWWVRHLLGCDNANLVGWPVVEDAFAILRCTSPFFAELQIRACYQRFLDSQPCDSVRVMRQATENPGKQWSIQDGHAFPVLPYQHPSGAPWHSSQTATLPKTYIQAGAMEVAWTRVARQGSISGDVIVPYLIDGATPAALDINTPDDFARAEQIAEWFFQEGE